LQRPGGYWGALPPIRSESLSPSMRQDKEEIPSTCLAALPDRHLCLLGIDLGVWAHTQRPASASSRGPPDSRPACWDSVLHLSCRSESSKRHNGRLIGPRARTTPRASCRDAKPAWPSTYPHHHASRPSSSPSGSHVIGVDNM